MSKGPFRVAIASGKGGTGKTALSVSLALALSKRTEVVLLDCDVEEPNCGLFLDLQLVREEPGLVPAFEVDGEKCSLCGKCAQACRFNAIAVLPAKVLFFPEMCHGCGGCLLACPEGAIRETVRENGWITFSENGALRFVEGALSVGEAMAAPLIDEVKKKAPPGEIVLIDSPPGTACAMLAAVRDVDLTLLVTEPTPFGLNDLRLAVDAVREIGIPFSVVLNRVGSGDGRVEDYCREENVLLAASIPDSREVAETYSQGRSPYGRSREWTEAVDGLADMILEGAGR